MKDNYELYLNVNVLKLAFVFQTFRKEPINYFELDPAHYLYTPGYSWDLMLKFTLVYASKPTSLILYSQTLIIYMDVLRCNFSQLKYLIGLIQKHLI